MKLTLPMKHPRRLRVYTPFALVLALVTITIIAHLVQRADPTDSAFLSPTSTDGQGASLLAGELRNNGRTVDVRTGTLDAVEQASQGGPATVFITTPELVNTKYLELLALLPSEVRVVMVAPRQAQLDQLGLNVTAAGPRWTAAAPQPGCAAGFATPGPVAAFRWSYPDAPVACYNGGVVEVPSPTSATFTLVGAADPFRNDRADEHQNHAFAVRLLAREGRVIWLDLHTREQLPPSQPPTPRPQGTGDVEPNPDPDATGAPWDDGDRDDSEPGGQANQGGSASGDGGGSPLAQAFPPAVWATVALLVLAALALALASARRLGTPVAEPLPVRVRAAETVRGLGSLYRRAKARGSSLATVQAAARTRLIEHFGLPAGTSVDELAAHVAARTGQPDNEVRHLLEGGVEDSDEELARAASDVQRLVRHLTERNVT
ncbi:DUF4350 domain-containing protein [Actinoplanes sp. TFC3]|uniref:DUF4350 domain-containing protein n=1 Tax=Actinoplanes sp. TFC3 TaxID=1710355 RepID=UPI0008361453|nr:DUF4350 domain-containing protein [Actinoplanes sp. TFC3]